ncbi:MAG: phosphoglucosamine mutase, partial [Oscillospiraceae bacterium]|nr:phosphoglucosamine mutase [Oscillospiraceae bacterium]
GRDTRASGEMLDAAVAAGLCSAGADVVRLGVVPTPAVAWLTTDMAADAGVMLSASHNPAEYNGIKIFGPKGFKLTDDEEFEIEDIVLDHSIPYAVKWGAGVGRITEDTSAVSRYVDHLAKAPVNSLKGLRVAVDCANGSASATAAQLFAKLGVQCDLMHCSPDGMNINENCGSTHIGGLAEAVRRGGYDMGVAFDGDADRCLAVDEQGNLLNGDKIMAILALYLRQRGILKGDMVVATVMSNLGFFKFAEKNGLNTCSTKVGDRYVLERMLAEGYSIGGEQSGHVIFLDHMPTGDGQLTALLLMDALRASGKKLSELGELMREYPQVLVNLRADAQMKAGWEVDEGVRRCIEGHNNTLNGNGRILVRASGTEPLIRVMVEGQNQEEIAAMAQNIADTIRDRLEIK